MLRRRSTAVALAAVLTLPSALVACGSGAEDQQIVVTTVVTETVAPAEDAAADASPAGSAASARPVAPEARTHPGSPTDSADCGIDTEATEIYENISQVPEPQLSSPWMYRGESDYDPCADLSYALLRMEGSTSAQSQTQVMLFHRGDYLGVGLLLPQVYREISGDGTTVYTKVIDYEAMSRDGVPNAGAADYEIPLNFTWTGTQVEPVGRIPNRNYW